MTPERYEQVKHVFAGACRLEPEPRRAYLNRICADDHELRAEVEELLLHDDHSLPIKPGVTAAQALGLNCLNAGDAGSSALAGFHPSKMKIPACIGSFRILRELGRGGMGVVYEAEQDNPRRTIALKVIRPGAASEQILRRFKSETQILGRLQHPGIAQVYEAGAARIDAADALGAEQPYFAMEYVRGQPLGHFISAKNLSTRRRLELFAKVCDAVQHAHQKGVIHRDLKPGNILVDDSGQPKILDFGVARVTDSDVQITTMQTDVGQLIGTIPYMSPEQVAGDSRELDTRSDVYALGVICYQLLTGRLPHDLTGKTIPEAARAIAEDDPIRLSSINKIFRGDLDTIVAKALEKDKERRYQSASDFAADLRRYLADEPIQARPATTLYQIRKFARRNKTLVAGIAAVFVVLGLGVIGTSVGMTRAVIARQAEEDQRRVAETERDRAVDAENLAEQRRSEAERQVAIAQAVNDFLNQDLLAAVRPDEQGRDVTVKEVLDRASQTVEGKFPDEPIVEASIRNTLGKTYHSLGQYDLALLNFEAALALNRANLGEDHVDTLVTAGSVALAHKMLGHFDQAEVLYLEAYANQRRVLGEYNRDTLGTANNLARLYDQQGRREEAEKLSVETLASCRQYLGDDHESTTAAIINLAEIYLSQGRYDEAESLYREAVDESRRAWGDEHPMTLSARSGLAQLHLEQGRYEEAADTLAKVLASRRIVLGEEHPYTLSSMDALARLYKRLDRLAEAEELYGEELVVKRRVLGEEHPHTLNCINNLANLYSRQGRLDESTPLYARLLELRRKTLGADNPKTLTTMGNLAAAYCLQGLFEQAEPLLVETLEIQSRTQGSEDPKTLLTMNNLALLYKDLQRYDEAETLHSETLEIRRRVLGETHPHTLISEYNLAQLYLVMNRPEAAAVLSRQAWEGRRTVLGEEHVETQKALAGLVDALIALERFDEAEPLALECYEQMNKYGPDHVYTQAAVRQLVKLYEAWNKPDLAAEQRAKLIAADDAASSDGKQAGGWRQADGGE